MTELDKATFLNEIRTVIREEIQRAIPDIVPLKEAAKRVHRSKEWLIERCKEGLDGSIPGNGKLRTHFKIDLSKAIPDLRKRGFNI